jgi:dTDP-4-amino-4,6-dideoxygalactose transaminase
VEKYTWVDLGSSYLLSDLLAAFLLAQLEARVEIQSRRKRIWEFYEERLRPWTQSRDARLPAVPDYVEHTYHLFYLILKTPAERNFLIEHLSQQGVESAFHYVPLHLSKMGRSFGARAGDCPACEDLSERLLRLPFHNRLTEAEQDRIVDTLERFR